MKSCPTCGMSAEDRASFCPCCGTSFVESQPTPPPQPAVPPKPQPATMVLPLPIEKEKKGGHTLPIILIAVLTALAVGLCALWVTGGLAAMLGKDSKSGDASADDGDTNPSVTLNPRPQIAATYGDGQELTTGQYLAYLYLEFENLYYNQGLYQYEMYGMDPWAMEFPYGDSGEKLLLSDYIIRATQDNIKRQIVLQQMMKDYGISWIAEDEAEMNDYLAENKNGDSLNFANVLGFNVNSIDMGFNFDSYSYALKNANLNERSLFYGLYGEKGPRGVSELDLRQYFVTNYLSYKMISITMTDSNGNELDKDGEAYAQIMAHVSVYLDVCETQGFDAAYEIYERDQNALEDIKRAVTNGSVIPTYTVYTGSYGETDEVVEEEDHIHDHRVDADATSMDEGLAQAVRAVNVGDTTIVEFDAYGSTPTIALIERLNTSDVYEANVENIIYALRYEAFDQEVREAMDMLSIAFDAQVISTAKPEDFLKIMENM